MNKNPKISIVTAYRNRSRQFLFTLKTISKTKYDNYEIIVIDDGSDEEHKINNRFASFRDHLKIFRIDPSERKYINPCVPFNMGLELVDGEIVIIQNPECCHIGDIIFNTASNLKRGQYFSYHCYSTDEKDTQKLYTVDLEKQNWEKDILDCININNIPICPTGRSSWYNHEVFRPCAYHFLGAIYTEDLKKVGFFDTDFAHGLSYDDDEFIYRIKNKYNVVFIHFPFVIHQYHDREKYHNQEYLLDRNRRIYMDKIHKPPVKLNNL